MFNKKRKLWFFWFEWFLLNSPSFHECDECQKIITVGWKNAGMRYETQDQYLCETCI